MSAPEKFNPDFEATLASAAATRSPSDSSAETVAGFGAPVPLLDPGTVLGGRYEILTVLGQGGMGAVYKAQDRELDRVVALKTVRPEMASSPEILARFKHEVLLASQITHPNIIRLYDIGEAAGTKFITMEFIEGEDLRSVLVAKGKLAPDDAVSIIRQVCLALQAAHAKGVIHRDLKPQNVMLAQDGRVVVMDFGLARSLAYAGMTQTGALMGTMEYMSPEQAMAGDIDQRSDIFAVGLIFFELLTGQVPYRADSALASLLKRSQERAVAVSEIDSNVPRPLSNVVSRCLERDRDNRYPNILELLADLEMFQASGRTASKVRALSRSRIPVASVYKWLAIVLLAVVISVGSFLAWKKLTAPAPVTHAPVSVLVADFANRTGDSVFDGTLEPVFNLALEGASFITAYNRGDARKIARKVPQANGKLDEAAAQQVAVNQGVGVVVSGLLDRQGSGYLLSVRATQVVTGKVIASTELTATNKEQLVPAVTKAATIIRKALGDNTSDSAQRFAMETLTATSLEAIHEYAVGVDALSGGKFEEARQHLMRAVDLDPNFGLGYMALASVSRNLDQAQDAEKYAKMGITHIDRMTERERYRTRAFYYLLKGDKQKCVEEYDALLARYPSDAAAHNNLAFCLTDLRNLPRAVADMRQAVEILPRRPLYRASLAAYLAFAGDFESSEREGRALLQMDPSYTWGFSVLAFAQLGQGQLAQAADTYHRLEKLSPSGASSAATGLADLALYEGRLSDAAGILDKGAASDLAAKNPDRAAEKFVALAYVQLLRGQKEAALRAAADAMANSKATGIGFLAARVFAEEGEIAKARALASQLASQLHPEPESYGKLIEGEIALKEGNPRQAIKAFSEGKDLLDTWISRFDLARAYVAAGAFAEADSELDRCIKRRGEVLSLFLNLVPTYGYFPPVYYYQGRVREGLKSPGAVESYRTYLSIRGKAGEDPLLPEVRRRVGQ